METLTRETRNLISVVINVIGSLRMLRAYCFFVEQKEESRRTMSMCLGKRITDLNVEEESAMLCVGILKHIAMRIWYRVLQVVNPRCSVQVVGTLNSVIMLRTCEISHRLKCKNLRYYQSKWIEESELTYDLLISKDMQRGSGSNSSDKIGSALISLGEDSTRIALDYAILRDNLTLLDITMVSHIHILRGSAQKKGPIGGAINVRKGGRGRLMVVSAGGGGRGISMHW
ncbi:hypothetical protein Tco_0808512 [Tanacetum coccineum]